MLFISILLLIVSINCEDWCPYVKPNGTYRGLGIYHRYRDSSGNADFVMYNRAGYEWLFDLTYIGNQKYVFELRNNSHKPIDDKLVVYRFAIYEKRYIGSPPWISQYLDCTVKKKVKFVLYCIQITIVFAVNFRK